MEKGKILEKIYYGVDEGFGSARDLCERARKIDAGIALEMVSKWMRAQRNKQTRNYKNCSSYTAPFLKYESQIDSMDVSSLLRDVGRAKAEQPKFGMVCIDIFSKKLLVFPVNTNDIVAVYDALLECFKVLGQPLMICSDDEGALSSRKVQDFFKAEGITRLTKTHANQAERAIRRVKKMIADRLRAHRNKTWVEMMEASVKRYNNQVQTYAEYSAQNRNRGSSKGKYHTMEKHSRRYPRIEKGDYVRAFDKRKGNYTSRRETRSQWSEKTYRVTVI